jgi:hypothetical protein
VETKITYFAQKNASGTMFEVRRQPLRGFAFSLSAGNLKSGPMSTLSLVKTGAITSLFLKHGWGGRGLARNVDRTNTKALFAWLFPLAL